MLMAVAESKGEACDASSISRETVAALIAGGAPALALQKGGMEVTEENLALMAQLAELKSAAEPDDLTRIEGIGPKIQELIYAARIFTFVALSKTSVERLKEILDGGGERFQMHDPKTWPEQAQLAADGQWEKLDELQDLLRGGRED